jgi:hypothetical protein
MPKRVKNTKTKKPPTDVNQWARHMVELTTEQSEPTEAEVSKVMSALGRRGGKIGGKRRLETMTQAERSAIALRAAQTRWKKAKSRKAG